MPSPEPAVADEEFRTWVTRLRPCVCIIHPDARTIPMEENKHQLEKLQHLLKTKPAV
jgi:hypothetical protein